MGSAVGWLVGSVVGAGLGSAVGWAVGDAVGAGEAVGAGVAVAVAVGAGLGEADSAAKVAPNAISAAPP